MSEKEKDIFDEEEDIYSEEKMAEEVTDEDIYGETSDNYEEDDYEKDEDEDLEEIVQEEDYYEDMALNKFLANPWKQVSLDDRGILPVVNLEDDLPERKVEERDFEKENIEYELFKGTEGKYQSMEAQDNFVNENLTEEERDLDKMKRMYDNPMKLSSDFEKENDLDHKYVKVEDTKRTDYLMKKKFGDV